MRDPETTELVRAPLTATIVSDRAEFAQLEGVWDALLADSHQPTFFLRWRWNWLWWRDLAPPGSQLHIVRCVDAAGRVVGIAPLYRRTRRLLGVPYAYELVMIGTGIELKTGEYLDVLVKRGAEPAVAEAMAACLRKENRWDRLSLLRVPEDSIVVPQLMQALDGHATAVACDSAPYVDTSVTWQDYKRSLGRSMRRNSEYYARRLFTNFTCEFRLAQTRDELEAGLDDLVRLHQMRWRSAAEAGTFSEPEAEAFLRSAMRQSHVEGRLRLWTLSLNGNVEAALVGFLDNGILHYFQKGFNPIYAKDDLGTAMLSLCIRASFDDDAIRAFDFMGGGAAYKELWARKQRLTVLHEVSRATFRARCHLAIQASTHLAAVAYRSVTPTALRQLRRAWLRRRRVERSTKLTLSTIWVAGTLLADQAIDVMLLLGIVS